MSQDSSKTQKTIKLRIMEILDPATDGDKASQICTNFIVFLVLANIVAVILESVPRFRNEYGFWFDQFELYCIILFTIEYFLRVWSGGARYPHDKWKGIREYGLGFHGLVDLAATLPYYLQFIFPGADLRALRVLRMIRIFKLSAYNSALEDLINAIKEEKKSFISALYILAIAIVLSSSLMYYAENEAQPDKFSSIPASMYWSIISLTTVGYGDVSPITPIGKLLGTLTAVIGVFVVAIVTGIVAAAFASQQQRRKEVFESQLRDVLSDGVISDDEATLLKDMQTKYNLPDDLVSSLTERVKIESKSPKD